MPRRPSRYGAQSGTAKWHLRAPRGRESSGEKDGDSLEGFTLPTAVWRDLACRLYRWLREENPERAFALWRAAWKVDQGFHTTLEEPRPTARPVGIRAHAVLIRTIYVDLLKVIQQLRKTPRAVTAQQVSRRIAGALSSLPVWLPPKELRPTWPEDWSQFVSAANQHSPSSAAYDILATLTGRKRSYIKRLIESVPRNPRRRPH